VTLHRAELTDDPETLQTVLRRLDLLDGTVVFPMHPRTRATIERGCLWGAVAPRVRVIPAVGFMEMLALQRYARAVLTDSGGVQREAFLLGVPCFTVRCETEWPETLADGWNRTVGRDAAGLEGALQLPRPAGERPPLFGDGHATERIADIIGAWSPHAATSMLPQAASRR